MLRFLAIEKAFSGVPVLKRVTFDVAPGCITGVVGENGAGKSTLMNLLAGNLRADAGEIRLWGERHCPLSPAAARRAGVALVHQELNLFPNLSVAENLFLAQLPAAGPFLRRRVAAERAGKLLHAVGLAVDPGTLVEKLSAGERQLVEIAAALGSAPRVLVLDEPTTSLSAIESGRLFALLQRKRAEGLAVIYISHALSDVLRLCDDIVVLRDGAVVGNGPASGWSEASLVTSMVGRQLDSVYPARTARTAGDPLLEARNVTQPGSVRDISFVLREREILGVAGLMGAGRTELAEILFGLERHAAGEVLLRGRPLRGGPAARSRRGVAFLTENRREDGLCLEASLGDNMLLVSSRAHARQPLGLLDSRSMLAALESIRAAVRLQPGLSDEQPVKTLSGGNQQKVVLAKWLLAKPQVLILDEPTRGIDVGAKFDIYVLIHELAAGGAGVLVISSEIEELIGLCDRIIVMCRGRISDEIARSHFDRERILRAALPAEAAAGKGTE